MRIGTWNLDNKWSDKHRDLLLDENCDVWLLTEANRKALDTGGRMAGFRCHPSAGTMSRKQHYAAVLTHLSFSPLSGPHAASAAVKINDVTYCSTILPWRGCKRTAPSLWVGGTLEEMTRHVLDSISEAFSKSILVWGGDWNQSLMQSRDDVGSKSRKERLKTAISALGLCVPTAELAKQSGNGHHTIDHIAIPKGWRLASSPRRVDAKGLSDHDAYIVEVDNS
jgi:hypothetical protein